MKEDMRSLEDHELDAVIGGAPPPGDQTSYNGWQFKYGSFLPETQNPYRA